MSIDKLKVVAYLVSNLPSGEPGLCFEEERGDYGTEDFIPEFEALVRKADLDAALERVKVLEAESATLTKERDDARRARTGHFSPVYLLSNARRIQSAETARSSNWVLASALFAVGSTTARAICRENGIDPDGTEVRRDAAATADKGAAS